MFANMTSLYPNSPTVESNLILLGVINHHYIVVIQLIVAISIMILTYMNVKNSSLKKNFEVFVLVVLSGGFLISPHAMSYDLVMLSVAGLWRMMALLNEKKEVSYSNVMVIFLCYILPIYRGEFGSIMMAMIFGLSILEMKRISTIR